MRSPFAGVYALLLAIAFAGIAAGCGSNPPCKVTPAQVDSARAHAKATEARLDMAQDEKENLQRQLDELRAKAAEQGTQQQNELDELKRRSGGGDR
jgi:outer membrane PBP1 activator LpoA protein